jgi:hypothetical protein
MPWIALIAALLAPSATRADGVYKDRERLVVEERVHVARPVRSCGVPFTRTNCSPDYVGSEMGLSKPSYYGTRVPDDGLSLPRW